MKEKQSEGKQLKIDEIVDIEGSKFDVEKKDPRKIVFRVGKLVIEIQEFSLKLVDEEKPAD